MPDTDNWTRFVEQYRHPSDTELHINGEAHSLAGICAPWGLLWRDSDWRARVIHVPRFGLVVWSEDYVPPVVVEVLPDANFHIVLRRGPLVLARDARQDEDVDEPVDIKFDAGFKKGN